MALACRWRSHGIRAGAGRKTPDIGFCAATAGAAEMPPQAVTVVACHRDWRAPVRFLVQMRYQENILRQSSLVCSNTRSILDCGYTRPTALSVTHFGLNTIP